MSTPAGWTSDDISRVQELFPYADPGAIAELLDTIDKRGLRNPVAFALKNTEGKVAAELAGIIRKRNKARNASAVKQLRQGPECEHGEPGGMSPHPETGQPLCPICRSSTPPPAAAPAGAPPPTAPIAPASAAAAEPAADTAAPKEWTAADLMRESFAPPRWAVQALIPEGVMILAGAPKAGKSWLALGLAVAVADGGKALGKIPADKGPVLYLALEDTPRRLQNRLRKVLGDEPPPEALTLMITCPPLAVGGTEVIREWLAAHPGARLVIIDVLARVRSPVSSSGSVYHADYAAVTAVKKVADEFGVAIILVHHTRKNTRMKTDDFINELSGTLGLSGAADTIAVLERTRGEVDAILHITGRDVEENKWAMKFDAARGTWELIGAANEYALADTRRVILDCLKTSDGSTPKHIADRTGLDHELVKKTARRMAADGQLDKGNAGRYFIPVAVPPVPAVPDT